ncbi:hypothetical protein WJX74_005064 [Apatococcus lobatus]|uniref:DUF1517 domain-containing protein n=2 Tax=Apatococcus TaxID=904362 RepID=A0AAW1RUK9_9CHLO
MQTLAPCSLGQQRNVLQRSIFQRPSFVLHATQRPLARKPAALKRLVSAAGITQPEVDAIVAQSRQAQQSLEAKQSTSTAEALEASSVTWFQRLGLPVMKFAATLAVVAALAFGPSGAAYAARSGGRAGGSSFGASRSMGGSSSFGGGSARSFGGGSTSTLSRGTGMGLGGGTTAMSIFGPSYGYGYGVQSGGGGGVGTIVILGIIAALAISFLPGILSGNSSSSDGESFGGDRVAVSKVQVGLLGSARQLQRDLERMTRKANTNTPEGLHYLLQETVLSLNRNPDYWVYGKGEMQSKRGLDAGEDLFNKVSMEERSKFKEETLSNVGGRTSAQRMRRSAPSSGVNELIVVTIIVASQGGLKIPGITNQEEMRTSLNSLGALRSDQVMAVEILWTPQDDDDFYSKDEMFADYPTLNNL